MRRVFALAAFLMAAGVLFKLSTKPIVPGDGTDSTRYARREPTAPELDAKTELLERYSGESAATREMVGRAVERFGRNAKAISATDGLDGLKLLDALDLEALFLYEKHPREFRKLRETLGAEAAAELLLHWREYFGLKRADDTDRGILIAEIAALSSDQRRLATRYPMALPMVLAEPRGMTALAARMAGDEKRLGDALTALSFISLEHGASDLRAGLRTLEEHGPLALEAFRRHGVDGFLLVGLYGPVLELLEGAMPLEQSVILVKVNAEYIDELLRTHQPEMVARHLRHVASAGLIPKVGGSSDALRLVIEFGEAGERALEKAGSDAADVVFDNFDDPTERRQAVAALGAHGTMALAMLEKYATDPDFRQILRYHGAAIMPAIAQADAGPETIAYLQGKAHRSFTESLALAALFASGDNGQATIRTIQKDGLSRIAELGQTDVRFYQFLPLYDVLHLGKVMARGHSPTSGEMTWALVDGCFVVVDVLSLAALQPEGAVAAGAVRGEVKAAATAGAKSLGREAGASATRRWARWWSVRSAGGMYKVLSRVPEAIDRLGIDQIAVLARPVAARAGVRLSTWGPLRLWKEGAEVVLSIPPSKGLKYLSAQALQAGVGVVGFQKMEEHLASRRAKTVGPLGLRDWISSRGRRAGIQAA
jgi:hypothetical protein